jgi:hypothetical protein
MQRIYKLYLAILLAAVLAGTGVAYAQIGGGVGWFDIVQDVRIHGDLQADDDVTVTDQLSSADVTSSDDVVVGDDLTVTDDATLQSDLTFTKQTRIVVTDGSTITPLGSYQPISSTATTGTSSITAGTAGDYLILVNVGSSTITLTDTGTLKLSGNAALANNDVIVLLADGTNWLQVSPEGDN